MSARFPQRGAPFGVPLPFTRLLGREHEIRELSALLLRPEVRLVTLTGTAGIGKTRLAWQVLADLQKAFPAGCCFVSLATVESDEQLLRAIIQALGCPKAENRSALEHLVTFLQRQAVLLVLDNFEHLIAAVPILVSLLSACAPLKLLVTSRAVLRIQGEYEFQVSPLALPDLMHLPDAGEVAQYPAIALFLERAQAVKRGFQLTEATARCIAEICTRLDGLPLAIELAAARIKLLSPAALLARLEHRLQVLTAGGPDLPARHQTLRAALSWSYDLLPAEEQWLFRHLSVFVGGCQLEAIEALCAAQGGTTTPVLDLVTALLNHSLLVQSDTPEGASRLFLFETLREYGLECLTACGEREQAHAAHARYYATLVEEAEPTLFGFPPTSWLDAVERDEDNVRAALEYFLQQHEVEAALRLAGTLGGFWFFRGHLSEGRRFLERTLEERSEDGMTERSKARAHALYKAGWLALWQLDFPEAEQVLAQGRQLFQALGDPRGQAAVLNLLSVIEETRGHRQVAEAMTQEALQLCQARDEQRGRAAVRLMEGMQALFQGAFARTQECCTESLRVFSRLGDSWGMATNLHYLGWAAYCQGQVATARQYSQAAVARLHEFGIPSLTSEAMTVLGYEVTTQGEDALAAALFEEALTLARAIGNPITVARILCGFGHLALRQAHLRQAYEQFSESARLLTGMEQFTRAKLVLASCLEGLGEIAFAQGLAPWVVRCFSLAEAHCAVPDPTALLSTLHPTYRPTLAAVGAQLDEETFAQLWSEGPRLTTEQVFTTEEQAFNDAQALQPLPSQASTPAHSTTPNVLTGREGEILALLAAGLTNKQIAARLVLSPHTVSVHVQAIYRKVGVSSRSQATRYAIKHGLV